MRRSLAPVLLLLVCALGLAALAPVSASAAAHPTRAKRCRSGYKRVRVKHHGRTRTVCRKVTKKKRATKPATPAPTAPQAAAPSTPAPTTPAPAAQPAPTGPVGPSVADVESIIRGGLQAGHLAWLGPESIEVIFEQPTQVLPMVQYDPYAADPLHAGGAIEAWPVRAWTKSINHHDATPEDDTRYAGCDGHLDHAWPHDGIYMFFRSAAGGWDFKTTPPSAATATC